MNMRRIDAIADTIMQVAISALVWSATDWRLGVAAFLSLSFVYDANGRSGASRSDVATKGRER